MTVDVTGAMPSPSLGCIFFDDERLPESWRRRAVPLLFVPLLPDEGDQLLALMPVPPKPQRDEDRMALVAAGIATEEIGKRLGLSGRSVQRRIALLRKRFGVESKADLARHLASRGFAATPPEGSGR